MADNLYLMASRGCPHGLILQQKHSMGIIKSYREKLEITKLGYVKLMPQQCKEPWRSTSGLKNSVSWEKHSVLVPYFDSPEIIKTRVMAKRKNGEKVGRDRDLYARNYFHAGENLLCLMDRNKHGNLAIHSLQKSGTELPELLTQVSASIAGTGLAVLFSVLCNVACGRVPFCTSKLLMNTGVGFGLVWLSWGVNKLEGHNSPYQQEFKEVGFEGRGDIEEGGEKRE